MKQRFLSCERGLVTLEFVGLSFALFITIFFVIEMTVYLFYLASIQQSAYMGARLAVVSDPAALGVPLTNAKTPAGVYGTNCSDDSAPCIGFSTATCNGNGTNCDEVSFNRILGRMRQFMPDIQAENVTISYAYTSLGYAGGPVIPAVKVTVSNVSHWTGVMGVFMGNSVFATTLPSVSVMLTGEDLN